MKSRRTSSRLAWMAAALPALGLAGAAGAGAAPPRTGTFGPVGDGAAVAPAGTVALPLRFEANEGQTDSRVRFLARGLGYSLFLTGDEAVLALPGRKTDARSVVRMRLQGARRTAKVRGQAPLAGRSHYLLGSDPGKWKRGVHSFARVQCEDVLPGIDMVYYGRDRALEYDFVVAPGASPSAIQLAFDGAAPALQPNGDLGLSLPDGAQLQLRKPVAYQVINGKRVGVPCEYRLSAGIQVIRYSGIQAGTSKIPPHPHTRTPTHPYIRLAVGRYDHRKPLVIDPVLFYSTYLGGRGFDAGTAVAVDQIGNTYVAGYTESLDFPVAGPGQPRPAGRGDAFVVKLGARDSTPLFATYLGGGGADRASGIAVDADGSVFVTGATQSGNFPTARPFQAARRGDQDAFLTKLSPDGDSLLFSTYLGGGSVDDGAGVALGPDQSAYVTGFTRSRNFPTTADAARRQFGGGYDAFVARFGPAGQTLLYSTFIGGRGTDTGKSIAVDAAGSAYVAGLTDSASGAVTGDPMDFPATAGAYRTVFLGGDQGDGYVVKLAPDGGSIVYGSYIGGSGNDEGAVVAVDSAGNAYVAGTTSSADVLTGTPPDVGPSQSAYGGGASDAFLIKLAPAGDHAVYATYLGGTGRDVAHGLAVDRSDIPRAYLVGSTDSTDFPLANEIQRGLAGSTDAFVAKLHEQAPPLEAKVVLDYSTYLGGGGVDIASAVAVNAVGNASVTGTTSSSDFPTLKAFLGGSARRGNDGFVFKVLSGATVGGGILSVPTRVGFGTAQVGSLVRRVVTIRNRSTTTELAIQLTAPEPPFGMPNGLLSVRIAPRGIYRVVTFFRPSKTGAAEGVLRIESNDPFRPVVDVRLEGTGKKRPAP